MTSAKGTSPLVLHGPSAMRSGIVCQTGSRKLHVPPSSKNRRKYTAVRSVRRIPGRSACSAAYVAAFVDLPRAAHALELVGGLVQAARGEEGSGVRELERCEQLGEAEPHRRGVVVEREPARVAPPPTVSTSVRASSSIPASVSCHIGAWRWSRGSSGGAPSGYGVNTCGWSSPRTIKVVVRSNAARPLSAASIHAPARVEHVAAGEQVQGVESLPLHLRLDLGDALAAHAGEIELVGHRRRC